MSVGIERHSDGSGDFRQAGFGFDKASPGSCFFAFYTFLFFGEAVILRLLIGLGLDLDRPVGRSQKTPVRIAAENGNHEILEILAEAGIDTTLEPDEQFLEAIRTSNNERLTQILAEHLGVSETATSSWTGKRTFQRLSGRGVPLES